MYVDIEKQTEIGSDKITLTCKLYDEDHKEFTTEDDRFEYKWKTIVNHRFLRDKDKKLIFLYGKQVIIDKPVKNNEGHTYIVEYKKKEEIL